MNEYTFPMDKVANVQTQVRLRAAAHRTLTRHPTQLEKLISKNYYLHQSARDGYRSYLQAYASYSLKKIFDVNKLDLAKVGRAFGFAVPPKVNISIGSIKAKKSGTGESSEEEQDDEAEPAKAYYRKNHQGGRRGVKRAT